MQPKAMAGVPDNPGHVEVEQDRYYVHRQLGVPRLHKRNVNRENKRDVPNSHLRHFLLSSHPYKNLAQNAENPAKKTRKIQPNPAKN